MLTVMTIALFHLAMFIGQNWRMLTWHLYGHIWEVTARPDMDFVLTRWDDGVVCHDRCEHCEVNACVRVSRKHVARFRGVGFGLVLVGLRLSQWVSRVEC